MIQVGGSWAGLLQAIGLARIGFSLQVELIVFILGPRLPGEALLMMEVQEGSWKHVSPLNTWACNSYTVLSTHIPLAKGQSESSWAQSQKVKTTLWHWWEGIENDMALGMDTRRAKTGASNSVYHTYCSEEFHFSVVSPQLLEPLLFST